MKFSILAGFGIFVCCLMLVGCEVEGEELFQCETSRYFGAIEVDLDLEEARKIIVGGLSVSSQASSVYYEKYGFRSAKNQDSLVYILADSSSTVRIPDHILLSGSREALWVPATVPIGSSFPSSRYRTKTGPVAYRADFAIRIDRPEAARLSRISVFSFNSEIYHGKVFNWHALGYVSKTIAVPPAKSEEYRLLQYLGHLLDHSIPPMAPAIPAECHDPIPEY